LSFVERVHKKTLRAASMIAVGSGSLLIGSAYCWNQPEKKKINKNHVDNKQ